MKERFDNRKGFTLVEILVVLALTMMIMMLVFPPLVNSLKITRQAEIIVRAQDSARFALAQISSDLADAMYVYDNTLDPVNFPIPDAGGAPVVVRVIYAKVDLVLPKMRGFCPVDASDTPGGAWRGDEAKPMEAAPMCPSCGVSLEMRPIQPLVQSDKIVRYFIGLKDPTRPYSNGFRQRLAEAGTDNMFILYRAEFHPSDDRLFPSGGTEDKNRQDPNFFYNPNDNGYGQTYAQAWREISRPVGAIEDVDLATIEYDTAGNPTSVTPTVKFTPTAIYNDPLTPTASSENNPDQGDAPPTVYKATYGHWVLPYKVVLEPAGGGGVTYETSPGLGSTFDPPTDMCLYRVSLGAFTLVFNITHYERTKANSIYGVGEIWPLVLNQRELAFTVDTVKGSVNFAFPNVDGNYCIQLNDRIKSTFPNIDAKMPLSDVANTADINTDPAGRLLINCAPSSGPDPRIFDNATIVPGSVKITAPDAARAGATPPQMTYTRTPFPIRDPQPNQFSADIAHNRDAADNVLTGVGAVYFCRSKPVNPTAGQLPPSVNNVWVYYEVQNNRKGDVLRASYVTKSVMTIMVGIRIYDSTSGRAQMAQFTNKVRLRNVAS